MIDQLKPQEIKKYLEHTKHQMAENGKKHYFSPIIRSAKNISQTEDSEVEDLARQLENSSSETGFQRVWISTNTPANEIEGSIIFKGAKIKAEHHRLLLEMGIMEKYSGKGLGSSFMELAITWARSKNCFSYIDLNVFASNTPALGLYKKFGFKEIGRINDRFRIGDISIDDILMTLSL